jgi:zinc-binding alcohol dehydrogenase family protein
MRAVGYTDNLPIKNDNSLIDLDLPKPSPEDHDILVQIHAVSVNPRDIKSRKILPASKDSPRVLGYDASGIVEKVGSKATLFKPGDAVFYAGVLNRQGSNAEYQVVDERIVGRKPCSIDHAMAAAIPLVALTAGEMLFDRLRIKSQVTPQQSIFILGGAGGVPSMTIQLANYSGLTVIASASRPESEQWVRTLGAQHVINHMQPLDDQLCQLKMGLIDYIFSTHTSTKAWNELSNVIAPQGKFGLIPIVKSIKTDQPIHDR